jgi:hypothetical protein
MKTTFVMLVLLCAVIALECPAEPSPAEHVAADIQKQLPQGWTCTLISEKSKMGHPHGLDEPLFRLDFINTNLTLKDEIWNGESKTIHPNLRLHFHNIAEREHVLQTIEAEKWYSWPTPSLFAETKEYVIVTSSFWQNHVAYPTYESVVSTKEANDAIAPLLTALRAYFAAKK